MKTITLGVALMLTAASAVAQTAVVADSAATDSVKPTGFQFTTIDSVAITPVKNQKNAGTCWSYSGIGFLESELLRSKGKTYDLSEMYIVRNTYMDRATKAVRMHGDVSFSQGGSFYDVIYGMETFGLVPDEVMPAGAQYGDTLSNHTELSAVSDAIVEAIAKGKLKKLQYSPDGEALWHKAIAAVHDIYLGANPEEFTYEGKKYTPQSFYQSTGLKASDYVSLTSFTHHPYGTEFAIEVQDNWRWGTSLNVELDDMMAIIDGAIKAGYTVLWGADVSEDGFTRDGLAVYPDVDAAAAEAGSDQARWLRLSPTEKRGKLSEKPLPQKKVTADERQRMYDNYETTDDHGMLIFGTAKDQEGNLYYMVKNSWGLTGKYNGIWYATPEFVRAKTMNYVVNKKAIPAALAKKYNIK